VQENEKGTGVAHFETVDPAPILTTLVKVTVEHLIKTNNKTPQELMNTILLQIATGLVNSCPGIRQACMLAIWDNNQYHLSVEKSKTVTESNLDLMPEIVSKLNEAAAAVEKLHAERLEELKKATEKAAIPDSVTATS